MAVQRVWHRWACRVLALGLLSAAAGVQAAAIVKAPIGSAGRINYVDEGPKTSTLTPVMFVHSFAGSASHWDSQIEHLRAKRRVVAIDLRGHGKSDAPLDVGGYSIGALASDIGTLADHLMIERFVLVGHGIGAAAAIAYAQEHPGRVESLVLVGAPGRAAAERSGEIMRTLRTSYEAGTAELWNSLMEGAKPETRLLLQQGREKVSPEAALSLIDATLAFDPMPALNAYPGPKLFIDTRHGDGRTALYRQTPDVSRRVISGTSLWPQLDMPSEFNRVLDAFL